MYPRIYSSRPKYRDMANLSKIIQNHNFHFRFRLQQHIRCNYGLHVDVKTKLSQVDLLSDEYTPVDIINLLWSDVCVHQVHTFHSYQGRP